MHKAGSRYVVAVVATAAFLLAGATGSASAAIQISSFAISASTYQAGAHPNVTVDLSFSNDTPKDLTVSLPAGLVGDPTAAPKCTLAQLNADNCPANTQVGTSSSQATATALGLPIAATASGNVYLMAPQGSEPVDLGIDLNNVNPSANPIRLVAPINLRPTDGGLDTVINGIPDQATGVALLFGGSAALSINSMSLTLNGVLGNGNSFMTNPTTCSSQNASAQTTGWGGSTGNASTTYQATGCNTVAFSPSVSVSLGTPQRDTPTSVTVQVTQPDPGNGNAYSALDNVSMTLPPGLVLNPGVADGTLTACTDVQLGAGSGAAPTCPASSQIGTTSFTTPLLPVINGTVYLGTQVAQNQYRIFVDLPAPGAHIKLVGIVSPDVNTGQVTAQFTGLPQIPLTNFTLSFQGGTQAVFVAPTTCGALTGSVDFTPWSGTADVIASPQINIVNNGAGACPSPPPLSPSFSANVSSAAAGASTNLTLTISRSDPSSDRLNSMAITLPPGLVASIVDSGGNPLPTCSNVNLQANTCPLNTKLGTVSALVGSGTGGAASTITLPGGIYLAAGTGTAPADLAVVLPAVVGPFNLGNIVTLAPISVDPVTGAISQTATLPTIVQGIPINMRQLTLTLNAANFVTNSTNCSAKTFSAWFTSVNSQSDQNTPLTAPYQATGCNSVPYTPSVSLTPASAGRDTAAAVTVNVTSPGNGQATTKNVSLTLPPGLVVNPAVASGGLQQCTDAQFGAGNGAAPTCPSGAGGSQIGTATFASTLLPSISGTVYIGQQSGPYPFRVFVDLPITPGGTHVKLVGNVTLNTTAGPNYGQVTTVFTSLPEIPFKSFQLAFNGGNTSVFETPTTCGSFNGSVDLAPWTGTTDYTSSSQPSITATDAGCPNGKLPFAPTLGTQIANTQAGAATNVTVTLNRPDGNDRPNSLSLTLPAGLNASLIDNVGNPLPTCSNANLQANSCAANTQVGTVSAKVGSGGGQTTINGNVYLMAGTAPAVAALGIILPAQVGPFNFGNVITTAQVTVDPTTAALTATAQIPTTIGGIAFSMRQLQLVLDGTLGSGQKFMTNATTCAAESFTASVGSVSGQTASNLSSSYQATGCNGVAYSPTAAIGLSSSARDTAAGVTVTVSGPAGQSTTKKVSLTLPPGLVVNPSVASGGGLQACTDVQLGAGSGAQPTCPNASQIGTATFTSTLLAPISGKVYIGTASGPSPFRVFVDLPLPGGTHVELIGTVSLSTTAGPTYGQVTTVFDNLPQIPFTSFQLVFNGGANGVFDTPTSCGVQTGSATMTPWTGGGNVVASPSITISNDGAGGACPNPLPFAPTFATQLSSQQAGAATDLTLTVNRPDRNDRPNSLAITLPAGLTASLIDSQGNPLPTCSNANLQANNCAAGTKVGTVTAAVGSGAGTTTITGGVYLMAGTPPAVAALGIVLPAQVGPFNFGNATSVAPVTINPANAAISTTATIPTTVGGIAFSLRQLQITLNGTLSGGQQFMTNATTCTAESFSASVGSVGGQTANGLSSSYQATGCNSVPFSPSVTTTFSPATRDVPSAMTTTVTLPGPGGGTGQSAVQNVALTLPQGVSFNPGITNDTFATCSDGQWDAGHGTDPTCPVASQIGTATFASTLLPPINGKVYIGSPTAQNPFRVFVDLPPVAGVNVKLTGLVALDPGTGQITATFSNLPQIPFTSFQLSFNGEASGNGTTHAVFIAAPASCQNLAGSATLTPWSGGSDATVPFPVTISEDGQGSPCSPGFSPTLTASLSSNAAAANTNLTLTINRSDRDARPSHFDLTLPPGLVASVLGLPTCSRANVQANNCAGNTQLGTVSAIVGSGAIGQPLTNTITLGGGSVYLTDPSPNKIATLAVVVPAIVGPFNLGNSITYVDVSIVPKTGAITESADLPQVVGGIAVSLRQLQIVLNKPNFFTNATICSAEQFQATFTSVDGRTANASAPYQATGCGSIPFSPQVQTQFTSTARDTPTGLTATLTQSPGQSTMQSVSLTLPQGVAISPGVASGGLQACTDDQRDSDTCPAASQIGTAEFDSTLLPPITTGKVFVGSASGDSPFRVFVSLPVAGVNVHLVGNVALDAQTGQITTTFDTVPPIPFTNFILTFQGGANGVFVTPQACGVVNGSATLTPSNGNPAATVPLTPVTISDDGNGAQCPSPPPFNPSLDTNVSLTQAGASPTLTLSISRSDRDSRPTSLAVTLPPGLSASLADAKGVALPQCSTAAAQANSCPADTLLGSVSATVGSGAAPVTLPGQIFLAQGTNGAPADLAIILPAVVGPFNLGTSVTLAPISVNPSSGAIGETATLPTIIGGVPLSLRNLTLTLNRPGFLTNATGCGSEQFVASLSSADGQTSQIGSPYQATGCGALKFSPGFNATIAKDAGDGGGSLQTIVTLPAGNSNLASADIALPTSLAVRPSWIAAACTEAQAAGPGCPASSKVGMAYAASPLLPTLPPQMCAVSSSLCGSVYLIGSLQSGLRLGIELGGPISLPLSGAIGLGSILTTQLGNIPDLPVSRFELDIAGGPNSMLIPTPTACDKPGTMSGTFTAHSGATAKLTLTPLIKPCPPGSAGAGGGANNGGGGIASMRVRISGHAGSSHSAIKATILGSRISIMRFNLPSGITLLPHRKGVRVKVDGKRLPAGAIKVTAHSLLLKIKKGASTIAISIQPPTLVVSSSLVKKMGHKRAKLKFKAKTRSTAGTAGSLTANVKA